MNARIASLVALMALVTTPSCKREESSQTPSTMGSAHRDGGCHCRRDASATPVARPLADTSVYGLDIAWRDQDDRTFSLASLRGSATVALMFYGTCQSACPVLVRDVLRVEAALSADARAHTRFVLVTSDPETDTPARLRALAEEKQLDLSRWTLLRASPDDVRTFATVLGVQFSRVGPSEFTHSNVITLLDARGEVSAQLEGLQQPVDDFAHRVEEAAR